MGTITLRATAMARDFQLIRLTVDEGRLKGASNRLRNQFVACMHAHNELTLLNRLLMFTMNDTSDGELHNSAQSVQMWCMLQLLAAKLFETWVMLNERFLQSNPPDVVARLEPAHQASLKWLIDYFGRCKPFKDSALKIIRDKTAFHYDRLNLTEAADNADKADGAANGSHGDRTIRGTRIALEDAKNANWHMHTLLYGLILLLMDDVLGQPAENEQQVRIEVLDAPAPERVGIPAFIDIGH
jgi:hypothetical protein